MNEQEFGYRIRQALNEGTEHLDYPTVHRLEQVRAAALASQRGLEPVRGAALQAAGGPAAGDPSPGWWSRLGLVAPLLALVIGFIGIYQYHEARRISELADMDFAVLLDDVPLDTYADKGFGALLRGDSSEL